MISPAGSFGPERRAWLGNGEAEASVRPDGTIDWYWPWGPGSRHALAGLADPRAGALRVGPVLGEGGFARRLGPAPRCEYLPGSNVARTRLVGPGSSSIEVVDFLPLDPAGRAGPRCVVRLVRGLSGLTPVEIELEADLTSDLDLDRDLAAGQGGVDFGPFRLLAPVLFEAAPLGPGRPRWRGVAELAPAEELVVVLGPADPRLSGNREWARAALEDTLDAWRSWLRPMAVEGPWAAAAERAALTLGALGALVGPPAAAGTTSVARRPGTSPGDDGRHVRLVDAAASVRVLADAGLVDAASAAGEWLAEALKGAGVPPPAWVDRRARAVALAEELPWQGFGGHGPVLNGRPAPEEESYVGLLGELLAAVGEPGQGQPANRGWADPPPWRQAAGLARLGPLEPAWPELAEAAGWLAEHWREPDCGRWPEPEGRRRLRPPSLLWVVEGLRRASEAAVSANPLDLAAPLWKASAAAASDWLAREGLGQDGTLLAWVGGASERARSQLDASCLAVAWAGPWSPDHEVVRRSVEKTLEALGVGPWCLLRPPGSQAADNCDLEASAWAIRALARTGQLEEAASRMDSLAALAEGSGCLSETWDPAAQRGWGNFPSARACLGVLDAALELSGLAR